MMLARTASATAVVDVDTWDAQRSPPATDPAVELNVVADPAVELDAAAGAEAPAAETATTGTLIKP